MCQQLEEGQAALRIVNLKQYDQSFKFQIQTVTFNLKFDFFIEMLPIFFCTSQC